MMWGESPNNLKHLSLCGNNTHPSKLNPRRNTIVGDTRTLKEMNIFHNLADLLTDYENWACKLWIDCSHVEFRVVTKKLWHFQTNYMRHTKSKRKANKANRVAACSMSWDSPSRLYRPVAKMFDPATKDTWQGYSNQLRQHHQWITFRADFLYFDIFGFVYTTPCRGYSMT